MEEINVLICTLIFRIKFKLFLKIKVRNLESIQQSVLGEITIDFHFELTSSTIIFVIIVQQVILLSFSVFKKVYNLTQD
jgi:hypothetical protein